MSSLAVKLPLTRNTIDGFTMIKDFKTLVEQNLKMLILTDPGERVMDPNFGVGARSFLFSNFTTDVFSRIESKIRSQVETYIPMITVVRVEFDKSAATMDAGVLAMRLVYNVPAINVSETLEITI